MLADWLYIGIFLIISLFLPSVALIVASILGPKKPNPVKNSTYECGVETFGESLTQFKVQYYLYALVFLVFDVEAIFLYPWAVAYQLQTVFYVVEAIIFVLILLFALWYAWRKGALEWV